MIKKGLVFWVNRRVVRLFNAPPETMGDAHRWVILSFQGKYTLPKQALRYHYITAIIAITIFSFYR